MRVKGAKNFHLADVTSNTAESYATDTPAKTERIISIEVDSKVDSEKCYSDDEVEDTVYGAVERTGKVTLNYLTPEDKVTIWGGEIDKDGVYFPPNDFTVKHHAMGFEAPTTTGKSKLVWYYDVVFKLPKEKAETSEGKPKFQSIELEFDCLKNVKLNTHKAELDMNGATANSVRAASWFDSVPTTKAESATAASPS